MLAYMKLFPSHLVGYISSGTGFAGIMGTLTLLILHGINLSNTFIFLFAVPTIFIYQASYFWLDCQHKKYKLIKYDENIDGQNTFEDND